MRPGERRKGRSLLQSCCMGRLQVCRAPKGQHVIRHCRRKKAEHRHKEVSELMGNDELRSGLHGPADKREVQQLLISLWTSPQPSGGVHLPFVAPCFFLICSLVSMPLNKLQGQWWRVGVLWSLVSHAECQSCRRLESSSTITVISPDI